MRSARAIQAALRATSLFVLAGLGGCGPPARHTIALTPEEAERWGLLPSAQARPQRHVIRMNDGQREWEVEFPETATGYEVRVPLHGATETGGVAAATKQRVTAADREMFEDKAGGKAPKTSYLSGITRVRDFYKARNYELALVHAVDLEKEFPNDEKLLAMKGSIYKKLGRAKLARETWERVLQINPDNATVAEALRELGEKSEDSEGGGR